MPPVSTRRNAGKVKESFHLAFNSQHLAEAVNPVRPPKLQPPKARAPSVERLPSDDEGTLPMIPATLRTLPQQLPTLPPKHTYQQTPVSFNDMILAMYSYSYFLVRPLHRREKHCRHSRRSSKPLAWFRTLWRIFCFEQKIARLRKMQNCLGTSSTGR